MDNNIPNPCNKVITSKNNKMETIPKNNVDKKKQKTSILFQHVQNIPRYEWKDPKAFEAMLKQQPIVITKTNLAGKGLEKWYDLDYLGENMSPSAMFHTYFCEKTFLYSDRNGKKGHPYIFDNKVREVEIPFLQFKNLLEKKINNNKHNNDDGDELIYLQQPLYAGIGDNITKDFSSMNWAWVNAMRMQLDFGPLTTNTLLIGQEGSTTPLHFDEQENFLHQIGGTKTCYLFAPSYYKYFYPYPLQHPCDRQSQINFDAIDFDRFSNMRDICCNDKEEEGEGGGNNNVNEKKEKKNSNKKQYYHGYKCVLEPGDVLYIPRYWWHHIINEKKTSMAINFWFKPPDLDKEILNQIPITNPDIKVTLSRNIEKLALNELKNKHKVASFFKYHDDKLNGKKTTTKTGKIIEGYEEYFKVVKSRLKLVLREEDIDPFLRDYLFNGRFSGLELCTENQ